MSTTRASYWSDFFHILFHHRKKVTSFFCAVLVATIAITVFSAKAYRSHGKLLVRLGPDPMASLGSDAAVANVAPAREYDINSVAELLRNHELLEKVVDAIGPEVILGTVEQLPGSPAGGLAPAVSSPAPTESSAAAVPTEPRTWWQQHTPFVTLNARDRAIRAIGEALEVEPVIRSNVVVVSCETSSPELAQAVVARLMASYIEEHLRFNRTAGAYDFLSKQTAELRAKLTRMEEELRDLKNEIGVVSSDLRGQKIQDQIGLLEAGLLETLTENAAAKAQIETLRKSVASLPEDQVTSETTVEDKGVAAMREKLYGLHLDEQQLLTSATKEYFAVGQIEKQIAAAKAILAAQEPTRREITKGPNRRFEEAHLAILREEPALAALEAKADQLRAHLTKLHGELAAFNEKDLRITQLRREIELCDKSYRKYVVSLEQARLDRALESERVASINIAQPATYEVKPVRPKPKINLALGLWVGIAGGVGLAFLAEYRRLPWQARGGGLGEGGVVGSGVDSTRKGQEAVYESS